MSEHVCEGLHERLTHKGIRRQCHERTRRLGFQDLGPCFGPFKVVNQNALQACLAIGGPEPQLCAAFLGLEPFDPVLEQGHSRLNVGAGQASINLGSQLLGQLGVAEQPVWESSRLRQDVTGVRRRQAQINKEVAQEVNVRHEQGLALGIAYVGTPGP